MKHSCGDNDLARALEECLAAIEAGETDLDALLGRYPQFQDELVPLLDLATEMWRRPPLTPLPMNFFRELEKQLRTADVSR